MKKIIKILFLKILMLSCSTTEVKPPNVIIIISDDQGYADVGFHGSKEILPKY